MHNHRFGTAFNCMDGRTQEPVAQWLKKTYQLDFVDTITEPGIDRLLAEGSPEALQALRAKVNISMSKHGSNVVAVVGHHDCAGNPVSETVHRHHIQKGLEVIRFWNLPVTVVGLWVNADWQVEVVNA